VREADVHADYDFDESSNASPDFLGDGGFSMVFKARNRATGELVAIKRVDVTTTEESAAQTNATVDPLEVEVAILRRLNHPHIVRLFEVIRPPPPPAPPALTTGAAAASATGAAGGRGGKQGSAPAAAPAPRKYMYIVTELVTGGELFYRVADGATPEPRAKGLFRQLCKAVAYLRELETGRQAHQLCQRYGYGNAASALG
jgi:serine/threonine protein kinase